jgi:hypothetical protein
MRPARLLGAFFCLDLQLLTGRASHSMPAGLRRVRAVSPPLHNLLCLEAHLAAGIATSRAGTHRAALPARMGRWSLRSRAASTTSGDFFFCPDLRLAAGRATSRTWCPPGRPSGTYGADISQTSSATLHVFPLRSATGGTSAPTLGPSGTSSAKLCEKPRHGLFWIPDVY